MTSAAGACERLAQSRERLRQALQKDAIPSTQANQQHREPLAFDWLAPLEAVPEAKLLLTIFRAWWVKQPLPLALTLAAQTAHVVLQPIAKRHPFRLVASAAVRGGALVMLRPWRWMFTPALMAGLLPQLVPASTQVLRWVRQRTDTASGNF